jgi:hypothetical protein
MKQLVIMKAFGRRAFEEGNSIDFWNEDRAAKSKE